MTVAVTIAKIVGAFALNGALFWLTLDGKLTVDYFSALALSELSALGIYHATVAVIPTSLPPAESKPAGLSPIEISRLQNPNAAGDKPLAQNPMEIQQ